jgi:hypothetical protein
MYDDSIVWEEYHHITTSSRCINRLMNAIHSGAEFCCLFVCLFGDGIRIVSYRIVSYRIVSYFVGVFVFVVAVLHCTTVANGSSTVSSTNQ